MFHQKTRAPRALRWLHILTVFALLLSGIVTNMALATPASAASDFISLEKVGTFNDENGDGLAQSIESITYSFTATNLSATTITNVQVNDPLIAVSGGTTTLSVGESDTTTFSGTYILQPQDVIDGFVSNQATITGLMSASNVSDLSDDPNDLTSTDDPTIVDLPIPEIALIKTAAFNDTNGDGFAQIGETVDFTFTIENIGAQVLTNVVVSDPNLGVVVSGSPIASLNLGEIDNTSYSATHTITQGTIDDARFSNAAAVSSDEGATDFSGPTNDSDAATEISIPAHTEYLFHKLGSFSDESGDGFAQVGETVDYTFTVSNTGDTTLFGLTITDFFAGVTVSGAPFSLAPGTSDSSTYTGTYTLTQADIDAGQFENRARLAGSTGGTFFNVFSDDPSNSTSASDPTVTTYPTITEVGLKKAGVFNDVSGDGFAQVGETIDYTFVVENLGDVTLNNVIVTDNTSGVTVSGSPIPTLAPGGIDSITYTATHVLTLADLGVGQFTNSASVATDEGAGDTSGTTNTDDLPTVVTFATNTDVALIKTGVFADENGDGNAQVGETINYTFTVENTGGTALTNLIVADVIGGVTVSGSAIGSLNPGVIDSTTYSGSYSLSQADLNAGGFINSATVVSDEGATDTSGSANDNDLTTATFFTTNAGVALIKTGVFADENGDGNAQVGETMSYTFTVENTGDVTLTNVIVSDTVGGVTVSGSPIASLAPSDVDDTTYSGSYTLTQADLDAGGFVNSATVVSDEGATDTSGTANDNDDSTTTTFTTIDEVALIKAGVFADENGDGNAQVGETMSYTFTVENTGDVTLTNVIVSDTVGGVTVSGSPIASLAPSDVDSTTYSGSYTLTLADLDAGGFANSATVVTDEGATDISGTANDNDDSTSLTFTTNDEVALIKAAFFQDENGDGNAQIGETLAYTFTVTNTGDVTLTNLVVSDPVGGVTLSGSPRASLAPGDVDNTTYTAVYTFGQSDIDAGGFSNSATVVTNEGATDTSGSANDNDLTTKTFFSTNDKVALIKAGIFQDENGDGNAQVGETIDYTFTVTNTGDVTLNNLTISDTVGGVTLSGSPIATLAPGDVDSTTYTGTYVVNFDDVTAGQFSNIATVTTDEGATDISGLTNNDDDTTTIAIRAPADLRVGDLTLPTIAPGQTGVFTIDIHNDGPGDSGSFDITYELQNLVTFDSSHPNPDGCTVAGTTVTCTVAGPVLLGENVTLTIPVRLDLAATGLSDLAPTAVTIINQSVLDPEPSNDTGLMGVTVGGVSVSGHVFQDVNRDGVLNNGEVDVSGVDVDLIAPGPDGTLGTTDDVALNTQTTASPYLFTNVGDGTYWLTVNQSTLPTGVYATNDIDSQNDNVIEVAVSGTDVQAQDFGVYYAAVSGVLTDDNGDPIGDKEITVTDAAGNTFKTTTNADGSYSVEGSDGDPLMAGELTATAIVNGETIKQTATIINANPVIADLQGPATQPLKLAFTGQTLMAYLTAALLLMAAGLFLTKRSHRARYSVQLY